MEATQSVSEDAEEAPMCDELKEMLENAKASLEKGVIPAQSVLHGEGAHTTFKPGNGAFGKVSSWKNKPLWMIFERRYEARKKAGKLSGEHLKRYTAHKGIYSRTLLTVKSRL